MESATGDGKVVTKDGQEMTPHRGIQEIGVGLEFSAAANAYAFEIASRCGEQGGAALIVDYGHNGPSAASVRGIKQHQFVDILQEPGEVDLVRLQPSCKR